MCTRPVSIVRKKGNITITKVVPCGKCSECIKKKQSAFVSRCIEECKKLGRVWFITLTYSEKNCPIVVLSDSHEFVRTLRREDVKKWKREVRAAYLKKYGVPFPKFSFIICGEYGMRKTHRPHYHGLLVGLDLKHSQILEKYWQDHFGFTTFKSVSTLPSFCKDDISCVARYVSKYCVKPQMLSWLPIECEKPRIMTSPGFGLPNDFERFKKYVLNGRSDLSVENLTLGQVNIINDRCKYSYNGCDYALPLYLRKKIFYEKGLNGNLQASILSKICSATLRCNTLSDFNRELQQMVAGKEEREAFEMVSQVLNAEKDDFRCREDSANKDLLKYYQKSKF